MPARVIARTATFAWSERGSSSLLATGTVSGALDESFSSDSQLEIYDAFSHDDGPEQLCSISSNARFNRLAWSAASDARSHGVLAAGMENGQLSLYDPATMLEKGKGCTAQEATIFNTDRHKGLVRGLAWNTLQPSLLASGATDAEIFIWDTKNLSKPYGPSANKSRHLTDITALAWNPSVAHILATASASGSTVVWDLKGRQEVIHLSYSGGSAPGSGGSVFSSGPKPVSSVAWHVERGTRVITACEDDSSPYILVWDLRNYRTPERILTGHEKGILSLDWCKSDPDLLLSCGKDCRTLAWNPSTGEMVGELPATTNWSFDVAACPRNPSYVATASFDGKISIASLQSTDVSSSSGSEPAAPAKQPGGAEDIFSAGNLSSLAAQVHPGVSLKQAPRWLKRPASTAFGFGGKLATLAAVKGAAPAGAGASGSEKAAPAGQSSSSIVKLHQVVTESEVVERALKLDEASTDTAALAAFCEDKQASLSSSGEGEGASEDQLSSWKLLGALFRADSREELVTLLGFSKADIAARVQEAVKKIRGAGSKEDSEDGASSVAREPLDQDKQVTESVSSEGEAAAAAAGSKAGGESTTDGASTSAVSQTTTKLGDGGADTEITEPSLFGGEHANAGQPTTAQGEGGADFFSGLAAAGARPAGLSDRFALSQQNLERAGSSVAATNGGSQASSVAGAQGKASSGEEKSLFRINSGSSGDGDSETERLLTRALVLGDFTSAVELCLSAERWADALLLAVRGGPELLARVQAAYFSSKTSSVPYLRVYRSIVDSDLGDVAAHGDLADWKEAFVVLCTFARDQTEYESLAAQLGKRLEAHGKRKEAMLAYVSAGKLENIVGIWESELAEDEQREPASSGQESASASAKLAAHARALQSFIEKVQIFKSASGYVDPALSSTSGESGYRLSGLYDRYHEYAELLASQGLTGLAVKYAAMTPKEYTKDGEGVSARERLQVLSGKAIKAPIQQQQQPAAQAYVPVAQQLQQQQAQAGPSSNYYAPSGPSSQQQQPQQVYDDPYRPANAPQQQQQQPYGQQQQNYAQQYNPYAPQQQQQQTNGYNPAQFVPQPPAPITSPPVFGNSHANGQQMQAEPVAPPAKKGPVGGWNDAPVVAAPKRTGSAAGNRSTPAPIFSPFPNQQGPQQGGGMPPPMGGMPSPYGQQQGQQQQAMPPPPPSRGQNRTPAQVGPPPPRGMPPQQPQGMGMAPQQQQGMMRPSMQQQMSAGPGQQFPPQGMMPPPQQQQQGFNPQGQQRFGPPQPQMQMQQGAGAPGPYGPPQGQGQGQHFQQQGPPQQQPPQPQFVPPPPPMQR